MHVRRPVAAMLVAAGFASSSALAAPCGGFTDVDDTNPATAPFCANVEWVKNRGITLGCTSPTLFCPFQDVSRLQMAAFLNRLGNVTFQQGGNAYGATAVLGTTDNHSVEIRANGARVMHYQVNPISSNVIGGSVANIVSTGVFGATIAGGGAVEFTDPNSADEAPNRVTDAFGTVGGGYANRAGDDAGTVFVAEAATVAGGTRNTASGNHSAVGGGRLNAAGNNYSTVAGGLDNVASGNSSTIVGGTNNAASNAWATVLGGY